MSGAVPVPVAGAAEELEEEPLELELEDPVELLDDDDVELPDSTLCTRAVISLSTRFKAVWLAMLARPFAWVTSACPIVLMSELSADSAWLQDC